MQRYAAVLRVGKACHESSAEFEWLVVEGSSREVLRWETCKRGRKGSEEFNDLFSILGIFVKVKEPEKKENSTKSKAIVKKSPSDGGNRNLSVRKRASDSELDQTQQIIEKFFPGKGL